MIATNVRVITEPAEEPVTLAEAQVHLRVDSSAEDDYISALITAARIQCEEISRRAFVTRTLRADLDCWPSGDCIELLYPPLATVTHIKYYDSGGTLNTWNAANYVVDTHSTPGRVFLVNDGEWPVEPLRNRSAIQVTYTAGYGLATVVPKIYKQAIYLLLGHLYENRESVVVAQGVSIQALPMGLDALLLMDRGNW